MTFLDNDFYGKAPFIDLEILGVLNSSTLLISRNVDSTPSSTALVGKYRGDKKVSN